MTTLGFLRGAGPRPLREQPDDDVGWLTRSGDVAPRRPWSRPARRGEPRRPQPYRWRVLAWRSRYLVAAVLLGTAAALAAAQLRPPTPPQAAVVVAARALAPGATLTADDVRVQQVPAGLVVEGSHTRPEEVVGRAAVVAVPAGLAVVDALLGDDRLAGSGPPGTVVVPVRLADPGVAALLRPGDRVDLFAAAGSGTGAPAVQRLAEGAVVLPHPSPDEDPAPASSGLLGAAPGGDDAGSLTLVAVLPDQAAALAGASGWAGISAVLVK